MQPQLSYLDEADLGWRLTSHLLLLMPPLPSTWHSTVCSSYEALPCPLLLKTTAEISTNCSNMHSESKLLTLKCVGALNLEQAGVTQR